MTTRFETAILITKNIHH